MSHRIVTTAAEGAIVQVVAGPVADEGDDDWYQISIPGSSTGWAAGRYLAAYDDSAGASAAGGQRTFVAKMTAYANGVGGVAKNARTVTGTTPRRGTVAVDPKVIPLGSKLTIEGHDGVFVAEDVGRAVKGAALDIWLPDAKQALRFGVQYRLVTLIQEGPRR
ncbi:MAG: 3D domain-containing protein [Chloroflexota bacterium]|nr:3D domain-containing protein [Chloroflexota bacterium]